MMILGSGSGTNTPPLSLAAGRSSGTPTPPLARLDPLLHLPALEARPASERVRAARALPRPPRAQTFHAATCSLVGHVSTRAARDLTREDLVAVLVDTSSAASLQKKLGQWAGSATAVTATTLVARVPRARLTELASLTGVKYVEASVKLEPLCDLAHASAGLVRAGNRIVPQTGRGVLIGVIDTGIDAAHPAFKKGGKTRILDYWDQTTDRRYDASKIDAGQASGSPDEIGHGTHVAGIAAGNGGGSATGALAGVAPDADLAIVKTTFDTADIARGIDHVFRLADQKRVPCVVNLSLGGHFGGHDGSSVLERTIDQLSGVGRVVVASAGNEGGARIHASTELPIGGADPARWSADFELSARVVGGQQVGLLAVQVWHQREDDLAVRLRAPNGEIFEPPVQGELEVDRQVFLVQASRQRAVYSGDHQTTFTVVTLPTIQWLSGWSLIVEEDRSGGRLGARVGSVHAWILSREMGAFKSGFTRSHLVGMPGTAFSAITVGSYATRGEWRSRDPLHPVVRPDGIHLEDVSYFSSPGPTRDGCNKPELAAPGQWVIAPLSQAATADEMPSWLRLEAEEYAALQGTSMSAPYVSGAVALLLEKNSKLDWAEVKRRLIKSTLQDKFTTPCWNARWGYGKLDVERLLAVEPE